MTEIKKLKQIGSLQDYFKSFEMLLDKTQLGGEQAMSCFLARLNHEIELMVRMFNPKTLQEACCLAKLQEALKHYPNLENLSRSQIVRTNPSLTSGISPEVNKNSSQSGSVDINPEVNKNSGHSSSVKRLLNFTLKRL